MIANIDVDIGHSRAIIIADNQTISSDDSICNVAGAGITNNCCPARVGIVRIASCGAIHPNMNRSARSGCRPSCINIKAAIRIGTRSGYRYGAINTNCNHSAGTIANS